MDTKESLIFMCVHSLNTYLLNICYEAGFIQVLVLQRWTGQEKIPILFILAFDGERETVNEWTTVTRIISEGAESCEDQYRLTGGEGRYISISNWEKKHHFGTLKQTNFSSGHLL